MVHEDCLQRFAKKLLYAFVLQEQRWRFVEEMQNRHTVMSPTAIKHCNRVTDAHVLMCWEQCNLAVFACQNAMKSSEKAIITVHIGWNISKLWIKKETDSDQNVKLGETYRMFSYIFRSFSGHRQLAVFWRFKSSVASPPSASWIGACGRRSWQNGPTPDSLKVLVACFMWFLIKFFFTPIWGMIPFDYCNIFWSWKKPAWECFVIWWEVW